MEYSEENTGQVDETTPPPGNAGADDDALWNSLGDAHDALLEDGEQPKGDDDVGDGKSGNGADDGKSDYSLQPDWLEPPFKKKGVPDDLGYGDLGYGDLGYLFAPAELARSCLRQRLYKMTDAERQLYKQAAWKWWEDVQREIEEATGKTVFEIAVEATAERVKAGLNSIEDFIPLIARIPNEYGRAELIRHLRVHFPDETWDDEPTYFRPRGGVYKNAAWTEEVKAEKEYAELKAKVKAGTATHDELLKELVLGAELQAAVEADRGGGLGRSEDDAHLREREIAGMLWVLNWLVRASRLMPKGKALTPMKPHEAAVVKRGHWHHTGPKSAAPAGSAGCSILRPLTDTRDKTGRRHKRRSDWGS